MGAQLSSAGRPAFASPDSSRITDQERAAAFRTYLAYAGSYRVEGDTVIHRVELCSVPSWVGTDLRRSIAWDGPRLVLTTPPMAGQDGVARVHRLVWERC